MSTKSAFKKHRDSLQLGIYAVINPFVRLLIKMGVTPNMVTTIGLMGNLAAAVLFAVAGYRCASSGDMNYTLLTIGGGLIILFSLFDMLDGQVARLGGMVSKFGAMYDSVLDRYCELFTLSALGYYMLCAGSTLGALVAFLALTGSIMVSYVRARAEGLGVECKVGFMQRPERVVVTSFTALAAGITGEASCHASEAPMIILISGMGLIAVFANLTAIARLVHCSRAMK